MSLHPGTGIIDYLLLIIGRMRRKALIMLTNLLNLPGTGNAEREQPNGANLLNPLNLWNLWNISPSGANLEP